MRATGVSCQEVLTLTGGEYMPTERRASWAAPSRPEAGRRPSQHERRRLQPTADSVCRGSWGTTGRMQGSPDLACGARAAANRQHLCAGQASESSL